MPFPKEGGIASPSTPGLKSRSVYITVDRILKWKETPGCKGCTGHSRTHTDECRARFSMLVEKEKEAEKEKKAPPPESETEVEGEEVSDPIPSHLSLEDKELFEEIFIRGEVPRSAEPSAPPEPAVSVSGVAILPQVANRCSDLCQKSLPVFGCPAVGKPTNRDNRRSRKAAKKASRPKPSQPCLNLLVLRTPRWVLLTKNMALIMLDFVGIGWTWEMSHNVSN